MKKQEINFPYHLDPNIYKFALFIENGKTIEEKTDRIQAGSIKYGEKFMAHCMALLILPQLMEMAQQSNDYKDFVKNKMRKLN